VLRPGLAVGVQRIAAPRRALQALAHVDVSAKPTLGSRRAARRRSSRVVDRGNAADRSSRRGGADAAGDAVGVVARFIFVAADQEAVDRPA
jgi:hypothetical protein